MRKVVSLIILVLILGIFLFIVRTNSKALSGNVSYPIHTATSSASQPQAPSKAMQTAQNFYNDYQNCMQHPPQEAKDNLSIYCQSHNQYAAKDLIKNLKKNSVARVDADPIICAQNLSQNTQVVGTTSLTSGTTSAMVVETYGAGSTINIQAQMIQENGVWKVSNILCPRF
jgi:hypothetical protein